MIRFSRRTRSALALVALTSCSLGLLTTVSAPAHAAACRDTDPRHVNLRAGDPDGDGILGGHLTGKVYVDRTGNGIYHACVAGGSVYDTDADSWGAAAWVTYEQWNGSEWEYHERRLARADGNGASTGYSDDTYVVRDYHVQVCLIRAGFDDRLICSNRG